MLSEAIVPTAHAATLSVDSNAFRQDMERRQLKQAELLEQESIFSQHLNIDGIIREFPDFINTVLVSNEDQPITLNKDGILASALGENPKSWPDKYLPEEHRDFREEKSSLIKLQIIQVAAVLATLLINSTVSQCCRQFGDSMGQRLFKKENQDDVDEASVQNIEY